MRRLRSEMVGVGCRLTTARELPRQTGRVDDVLLRAGHPGFVFPPLVIIVRQRQQQIQVYPGSSHNEDSIHGPALGQPTLWREFTARG